MNEEVVNSENSTSFVSPAKKVEKVGQDQIHELLFQEKLSWQAIIYDLINTEQLDPWDVDLVLLTNKYLEKVRLLEEANFFISSKVLFAASILLRIKSEILLSQDLPTIDEILFGKKEEKKFTQENIDLDEDVPDLVPRTPLPRFRRVTLQELMSALGKAITTENRRIGREIIVLQQEKEAEVALPKNVTNIKEKIREIYDKIKEAFENREHKLAFSELVGKSTNDKIAAFVSILHLDNQQKIWLEQESHFEEIWILLKSLHEKQNKEEIDRMRAEVEKYHLENPEVEETEEKENAIEGESIHDDYKEAKKRGKVDTGFSNEIEKEMED